MTQNVNILTKCLTKWPNPRGTFTHLVPHPDAYDSFPFPQLIVSITCSSKLSAGAPPGLKRWQGPTCSELILRFTILGGSHVRFPKVGRVRTRETRAVAEPMVIGLPDIKKLTSRCLYFINFNKKRLLWTSFIWTRSSPALSGISMWRRRIFILFVSSKEGWSRWFHFHLKVSFSGENHSHPHSWAGCLKWGWFLAGVRLLSGECGNLMGERWLGWSVMGCICDIISWEAIMIQSCNWTDVFMWHTWQIMQLKGWSKTTLGCSHQSTCMPIVTTILFSCSGTNLLPRRDESPGKFRAVIEPRSTLARIWTRAAGFIVMSLVTITLKILLSRLTSFYGISSTALNLIASYLLNRTQSVSIQSHSTPPSNIFTGIPQGSVLGPLLFSLYTSPVSQIFTKASISYHLYADDTQIYISFSPNQSHDSLSLLSSTLDEVYAWLTSNRLLVNPSKTEFLIIGNPQQRNKIQSASIVFCGNVISPSESARNLGVTFDSNLSLTKHISSICKSAYYQIRQLRQIRSSLDILSAIILANSLVISKLDYCNSLLNGLPKSSINRLQVVQNSLARTIYPSAKRSDHISPVLHKLHWLPVSSRIEFKIATLTFKVLKFQQPYQHTFMIWLHHTFLHDLLDLPTRIFLLCLTSDQKWAADHFPLLHLPFGILSLNISALQIHYRPSVVYSRPTYIKSLFHHSYQ